MDNTFYITTAIDYPNGKPHLGHAYEKIVTDFYFLFYKMLGKDAYLLTGTDENGQKLQETAQECGEETLAFVNKNVEVFKSFCKTIKLNNNDFIRTTEKRHAEVSIRFWEKLQVNGDLYFGKYSGQYCISCENFYTETQALDGNCPEHHKPLVLKEEDGYFFKISKYEKWIKDYIKSHHDFIVPENSRKELLSRLEKEPLKDIAFSRPNNGWGIPVPGNDNFVMYTWCDALVNYYSALEDKNLTNKYWPCDMHVIGKDILWFHGVIWPCMLSALSIELPKQIYVHGMILGSDGRKMSKSLNNGVDPLDMLRKYPLDSFRYYLLRNIPAANDGTFVEKELVDKHNNELGNDLGNLLMRIVKISLKHLPNKINVQKQELFPEKSLNKIIQLVQSREHNKAIDKIWESVNRCNQYINESKPWDETQNIRRFSEIVYNCIYSIDYIAHLLYPVIPSISLQILKTIGRQRCNNFYDFRYGHTYNLEIPNILFEKIEFKQELNLYFINIDSNLQNIVVSQLEKFKINICEFSTFNQAELKFNSGIIPQFILGKGAAKEFTDLLLEKRLKVPQLIIDIDASIEEYKKLKKMKFIKVCFEEKSIAPNLKTLLKRLN